MADIKKCDRCGKVFDRYSIRLFDNTQNVYNGFVFTCYNNTYGCDNQKDLCQSCLSGLLTWLNYDNK